MTKLSWVFRTALTTACLLAFHVGVAQAGPIGTLSFETITGTAAGTLSGSFTYDPTIADLTRRITAWEFTAITDSFGTHVYDSDATSDGAGGAAGASSFILSNSNGNEVFSFGQNFADGRYELDIVIDCHGTVNCATAGAPNISFSIVGGFVPCAPGETKCISSGEQRVFGLGGTRYLDGGFFNLTAGSIIFNTDSVMAEGNTLYTGGGTGDPNQVPEPSTLALLAFGGFGTAFARRRRR
jgi:PEP-CTERM motif-containing protein